LHTLTPSDPLDTRYHPILLVEDDANVVFLIRTALGKAGISGPIRVLADPVDAVLYLQGKGLYADRANYPAAHLVVVSVANDAGAGMDVLRWMRRSPEHEGIPVVVMARADRERDALAAYDAGANACVARPQSLDAIGELVRAVEYCRGMTGEYRVPTLETPAPQ
jgi:two-component system response regulator